MKSRQYFLYFAASLVCGFLCFQTSELTAKEQILPLVRNPQLRSAAQYKLTKSFDAYLTLPFLDDFSRSDMGLPLSKMWNKAQVFVNDGYGIQAPTSNIATFDALNAQGELYAHAGYDNFGADTLCSHSFALSTYGVSDSVTLYFQVQAGGRGAFPSEADSLCLEFYHPFLQNWIPVWSAKAYSLGQQAHHLIFKNWLAGRQTKHTGTSSSAVSELFFPVQIHLNTAYLADGFSFRFRNVASLTRLDAVPGLVGNTDHWNLGLVYLNTRAANDTLVFRDVLLMQAAKSVLNNYSAMPWKHFKGNSAAKLLLMDDERIQSLRMNYRSAGFRPLQVSRQFIIEDLTNSSNRYQTEILWDRLETDEHFDYLYRGYEFDFSSTALDSVDFKLTSIIGYSGAQAPFTTNDTLAYIQKFRDYYAYDDGNAENGYGIFGRWAGGSKVAIKYTNVLAAGDTLKGVYMYFNRVFESANKRALNIAVWNDFNGYPGTKLYDSLTVQPALTYGNDGWEYFAFTKPVVVRGDFYVGWEQIGEHMLNIGFDHNCTVSGKHFIDEGTGWSLSEYNGKGIPMIRPAFGHFKPLATHSEHAQWSSWKVYPNPCKGLLYIESTDRRYGEYRVELLSIGGDRLRGWDGSPRRIELGNLSPGYYLIRIEDKNCLPFTQLIVVH